MLFGGEAPTLDADTELASIPGDTEDDETDVPVEKKKSISQKFFHDLTKFFAIPNDMRWLLA